MAEPIIELGTNVELDEDSNGDAVLRNTSTNVEIALKSFIDIVGGSIGDSSNRVPDTSYFTNVDNTLTDTDEFRFSDVNESPVSVDPATGTVDIDVSTSNWHDPIAATENITITFSGISTTPAGNSWIIRFTDGDGMGPYTISWPASVVWPNGNAVTEISQNGDLEIVCLTADGGSTIRARQGGKNFS